MWDKESLKQAFLMPDYKKRINTSSWKIIAFMGIFERNLVAGVGWADRPCARVAPQVSAHTSCSLRLEPTTAPYVAGVSLWRDDLWVKKEVRIWKWI